MADIPRRGVDLTVVIPTRNRAGLLGDAIDSVLRSPVIDDPARVIVVDDDSNDGTESVARSRHVTYVRVSCGNPGGPRNAGLGLCDSEYVAFLDDDDYWLDGNPVAQLAVLEKHPGAGAAFGRVQPVNPFGEALGPPVPIDVAAVASSRSFLRNDAQIGSFVFRTDAIRDIDGFRAEIRFGQDVDAFVRLAAAHRVLGVDVVASVLRGRIRSSHEMADWASRAVEAAELWKDSRRAAYPSTPIGSVQSVLATMRFRHEFALVMASAARGLVRAGERDMPRARKALADAIRTAPYPTLLLAGTFVRAFGAVTVGSVLFRV